MERRRGLVDACATGIGSGRLFASGRRFVRRVDHERLDIRDRRYGTDRSDTDLVSTCSPVDHHGLRNRVSIADTTDGAGWILQHHDRPVVFVLASF